jgi:UDP-glucose 4-epimerase
MKRDLTMLINKVFEQFLSEQKSKLAPKTYRDYEYVMNLFEHQLDGYAWNNLDDGDKAYDKAQKKGKSFIDIYDHTHIEDNVGEFLDYFVPRKVMAGDEFILKTCPRVIRKLLKWMRDKKLVDLTNDDIKEMCENQLWEDSLRDMGF